MLFNRKLLCFVSYLLSCVIFISSCTVVKNPPLQKPFVYENNINITGNINKDEKKRLTEDLSNYWDDSLYARKVQQFGVRFVLKSPPVFDTANIGRSRLFMTGYLNSQGYYNAKFTNLDSGYKHAYTFDTTDNQIRTKITFNIDPGKTLIIDSLYYNLSNGFLDSISHANKKGSFIKEGKTVFSKQNIAGELDREVALLRQKGYFMLTRQNLYAEVDTTDLSLLEITTDPFEQARKIAEAAEKRTQNPTCIVAIRNRENPDSTKIADDSIYFKRYYVGRTYFYPETGRYEQPDSIMKDTAKYKKIVGAYATEYYQKKLFVFKVLRDHNSQRKGAVYNETNFYKTLNNFSQIGAWERVDYRTTLRGDTIDFHYFLTPAKKETIAFYLETSRNTGDLLATGTLIGLAFNTSYTNRNVWHRAIQSNTTFSNGVEFSLDKNTSLLQTFQSSLNHTYTFPKLIAPKFLINQKAYRRDDAKTHLNFSAAYVERKDFYRLRSLVTNWGYEWRVKNRIWYVKIPNIELYSLDTLRLLDSAFKANSNPFLRTSFNTGSVISLQGGLFWTIPGKSSNVTNILRLAGEESGAVLGRIKGLQDKIYQYIKFEAEFKKLYTYPKTALAFRIFSGVGYNYGKDNRFGKTLPFFKQFVGGGPNSMRAWGLRQIGLGSSIVSDTSSSFTDRYGDMQLEANIEYRFTIAQFSSLKLGSALFTDFGNIWNLHPSPDAASEFSLSRLGKDIAIGVGTGLRFDFGYFMIRIDGGIKLKDPARFENNGWLSIKDFTWRNYEYSVKQLNGTYLPPTRNNYAVQLGIGLPF